MLSISSALAGVLAQQAPAAFATTLVTIAIDRSQRHTRATLDCLREGWSSKDLSANPVLMAAFPYDREFTGADQTILLHTSSEHDFCLLTAKLSGETEIECLVMGEGFALVTRDLFSAGWCDWDTSTCSDLPLSELLAAIGR